VGIQQLHFFSKSETWPGWQGSWLWHKESFLSLSREREKKREKEREREKEIKREREIEREREREQSNVSI
jgi:hypothetical protein